MAFEPKPAADEYRLIDEEDQEASDTSFPPLSLRRRFQERISFFPNALLVALLLSLLANGVLVFRQTLCQSCNCKEPDPKTAYAELERNVPVAWTHDTKFASHNRTIVDEAWRELVVEEDIGVVALSDHYVTEKGLPAAQRWPRDSSKGLYLLHSYHNLHCLNTLRTSFMEMHDKVPQSIHFSHVGHCLDALRQDIMCNADDTPRFTGPPNKLASGLGQIRMCKDWGKLERWAKENSACYRYNPGAYNKEYVEMSQFRFCPDESRPLES